MRTLLADGNFKQDHLVMKYDSDDVPLSDGHGYMVTRAPFDVYLDATSDPVNLVRLLRFLCLLPLITRTISGTILS